MLLVNKANNQNHWLGLCLVGNQSNRSAIGARVTLHGTQAGVARVWVDEVRSGSSYNSSSDLRLHFGLGADPKLSGLDVRWPNGETEAFSAAWDQYATLVEGTGRVSK